MEEIVLSFSSSSSSNAKIRKAFVFEDGSDSTDNNYKFRARKRLKHDHDCKGLEQKHKGVVLQHNGNWGAQIYTNHKKVWLGTFKSDKEATMAYDKGNMKLRGHGDLNPPWIRQNIEECKFQNHYSMEEILKMIKDGSYQSKFENFVAKLQFQKVKDIEGGCTSLESQCDHVGSSKQQFSSVQLFQKELTPSDVGKLNRLVIPKKFATKYFPYISENGAAEGGNNGVDDMELVFYDKLMNSWTFRYCYWRSSQSFVFTRGWNRFVKDKNLKEKDIVTFYSCIAHEDRRITQEGATSFALIDVTYSNNYSPANDRQAEEKQDIRKELKLELNLGQNLIGGEALKQNLIKKTELEESKHIFGNLECASKEKENGLRLFGVKID